jgi:hypothetical protein
MLIFREIRAYNPTAGRCGTPNCHCHQANDPGHGPSLRLTSKWPQSPPDFKVDSKTVIESLPDQAATRKTEGEVAEFRKLQVLHKEFIDVNAQVCQPRPSEPDTLLPEESKRRKRSDKKPRAK